MALVFVLLIGSALAFDTEFAQAQLRRHLWYRRFELLPPAELRFRGMVALGVGLCTFAALLTLELLAPGAGPWPALALGILAVVTVTLGAALLERAAHRDGWR
ncbi:hypothetical protein DB30_03348 [Enhygromyxa salina]|uniref:Uncharacterized protein n=1 Tax=Enhygromyxa salina TaxID=215803 RepID=A0A0C1ZIR6_9BACT|nr:hypothetical protein DB30_03348 [Enhygromyxa salina]